MSNNTSDSGKTIEGAVVCENSSGTEIHGTLLRLTRYEVSFEIFSGSDVLRMSEVMSNFRILVREQPVYSGKAVITGLVNAGPVVICQANLQDTWLEMNVLALAKQPAQLEGAFTSLIESWQKVYRIDPDYKLVIADIQSFLFELYHWINEVELGISSGNGNHAREERAATSELIKPVTPYLNTLFERFEYTSRQVPPGLESVHGLYAKRQLHPLLLCSPFMHRIFRKPLGYAGDYEMVNMILRDPHEGSSLFAKLLNRWFLGQTPAEAHRNRVIQLTQLLAEETLRGASRGAPVRILNLGCGPAGEIQAFLTHHDVSDYAQFMLWDFNNETIEHTSHIVGDLKKRHGRRTDIQFQKKSVLQVIKEGSKPPVSSATGGQGGGTSYDFIYCAGLFDYLADKTCKQLMNIFYKWLAPGGLLVATNVDSSNPIRNIMGDIFEWRLIERNAIQMAGIGPDGVSPDDARVTADTTACNIFLTIRKPKALSQ